MKISSIIALFAGILVVGIVALALQGREKPSPVAQQTPVVKQVDQKLTFLSPCKSLVDVQECYREKIIALAEKNGVAKTLETIKEAEKDFPELLRHCNFPLGYELGKMAYKEVGDLSKTLALTTECRGGFLRGVIAELLEKKQINGLAHTKKAECPTWWCHYILGYFAIHETKSLSDALVLCKGIAKDKELLRGCFSGAIQEIIFLLNTEPDYRIRYDAKQYSRGEEFALCGDIAQEYKEICYSSIPRKYLFTPPHEREQFLGDPLGLCKIAPNIYRPDCNTGVGIVIGVLFHNKATKMRDLCLQGSNYETSRNCFNGVFSRLTLSPIPKAFEKDEKAICALVPDTYKQIPSYKTVCAE